MTQRVVVTGGAGFLGSHLCERLLAEQCDVLCVDNFYTGTKRNVVHLAQKPMFELMRHDITFPLYVECDRIYNLACPASPIHYQFDPVQTTKTSVHGAINMLGLAKRTRARILQASTSEVYGDPEIHPQTEDYWGRVNPIGPRSRYDEGKRCAETLFRLPAPAQRRHQGGADLQHLWAAHAAKRRTRRFQLHRAGAARRADHALRRRLADALVLLRRRPDRRHGAHDGDTTGLLRPAQPRQPGGVHHSRARRQGAGAYPIEVAHRAQAPAPGRSAPAQARHWTSHQQARLAAQVGLEDGLKETVRYFRELLAQ